MSTDVFSDDYEMETGDIDSGDLDTGGGVKKAGKYHFEIRNIVDMREECQAKEKTPYLRVDCQVLASGEGCSPVGTMLFHRIWLTDKSRKVNVKWLKNLGAAAEVGEGDDKRWSDTTAGGDKPLPITIGTFKRTLGYHFVCDVQMEEDEDGKYPAKAVIPYANVLHPFSEDAEDYPRDIPALKSAGYHPPSDENTSIPDDI